MQIIDYWNQYVNSYGGYKGFLPHKSVHVLAGAFAALIGSLMDVFIFGGNYCIGALIAAFVVGMAKEVSDYLQTPPCMHPPIYMQGLDIVITTLGALPIIVCWLSMS